MTSVMRIQWKTVHFRARCQVSLSEHKRKPNNSRRSLISTLISPQFSSIYNIHFYVKIRLTCKKSSLKYNIKDTFLVTILYVFVECIVTCLLLFLVNVKLGEDMRSYFVKNHLGLFHKTVLYD